MKERTIYERLVKYIEDNAVGGVLATKSERDHCFGAIEFAYINNFITDKEFNSLIDLRRSFIR